MYENPIHSLYGWDESLKKKKKNSQPVYNAVCFQ